MNFSNKTAIVTGAASGIGNLFCKEFVKYGGNVVMADINIESLTEKANEINSQFEGRAIPVQCDVRDYLQVTNTCDTAVKNYGSIDVMLSCAGGFEPRMCNCYKDFIDIPIEVFDWGLDVNLKGPFYFSHAAMKQMVKQHSGVIINIGSVTGEEGDGCGMAYPTAKSGIMHGLTKSLAIYGANHNVRAVCVTPGPVMTRPEMAGMKTLIGRAAQTQEIVDFIMYLASDKAACITGTNHIIDCGRLAMRP